MISFRKPKGVYNRNTFDWFNDDCAWGGAFFEASNSTPPFQTAVISLYNNANDGSYLRVLALTYDADGAYETDVDFQRGITGTLVNSCFPVRFDQPQPWGQIYQLVVNSPSAIEVGYITNPFGVLPTNSAFGGNMVGGPLWVIPAGYSLRFSPGGTFSDLGINLWYLVSKF